MTELEGDFETYERLTDSELEVMTELLARWVNTELDQWELWKILTRYGPVYIYLANALPAGSDPDAFATIWPPQAS